MNANVLARFTWPVSPVFLLGLLLVLPGCGGDDNGVTPPDNLNTTEELIVEDGEHAVWLSEGAFVFSRRGETGLYLSDLSGNVTTLFDGPHNYDYVSSPNGEYVAFSTPDLDGGVYVVRTLQSPNTVTLMYANGRQPGWLDHDTILIENGLGQYGFINLDNPGFLTPLGSGSYPRGNGSGSSVAYLDNGSETGFNVRFNNLQDGGNDPQLATSMGVDYVWSPTSTMLYGSRLTNGTLTDVVELDSANPGSMTTIFAGATQPSVSRDGNHLFAVRLNGGVASGVYYRQLSGTREETLFGISRPAAAPSGTRCLAENHEGIILVSFE